MNLMIKTIKKQKKWKGLIGLSDELLCKNAQHGCMDSKYILWYRYSDYIHQMVYNASKIRYLPLSEIDDALQESYFSFQAAVEQYEPQHNGKSTSFKTFLGLVVTSKFANYCTRWRIYQSHLSLDSDDEVTEIFGTKDLEISHISFSDWDGFILKEITSDGLAGVLTELKPNEIHLLQTWLQYGRDKDIARVLSISPAAAKLRRERLFRRIKRNVVGE